MGRNRVKFVILEDTERQRVGRRRIKSKKTNEKHWETKNAEFGDYKELFDNR